MMIKTYATDKRNEIQNEFITREEGKYEELNHVSKDYPLLHIGICLHSSLRLAFVGLAIFKRKMI